MNRRHAHRGFTLIELLVVIAIIALLVSILLPALSKVRETAKAVVCLSQIRQVNMGSLNYAEESKGFFTAGHVQVNSGSQWYYVWPGRFRAYMDEESEQVFNCPATVKDVHWVYKEDPRSFFARVRPAIVAGRAYDHTLQKFGYKENEDPIKPLDFITYGYNEAGVRQFSTVNGRDRVLGLGMHVDEVWDGINAAAVSHPAAMIALADARADGDNDATLAGTATYPGSWPSRRHYGRSNVAFVDGHATLERVEELLVNPPARPPIGEPAYGAAKIYRTPEDRARRWNFDFDPHRRLW